MYLRALRPLLAIVTLLSIASTLQASFVEHERRDFLEDSSMKHERVDNRLLLPVRIGADPDSPRFGKHYSPEEVEAFFAPSENTVSAVIAWVRQNLPSHTITVSLNKQWVQFDATVKELETLLDTEYHHYKDSDGDDSGIGCDKYHVPLEIRDHIDYITPGVKRAMFGPETSIQRRDSLVKRSVTQVQTKHTELSPDEIFEIEKGGVDCKKLLTPQCIKSEQTSTWHMSVTVFSDQMPLAEIYNIRDTVPKARGNTIATYNGFGLYLNQTDVSTFFKMYTDIPPGERPEHVSIDGAMKPQHKYYTSEPDLDLQAVYPLVYPHAEVVYYQVDDPVYMSLSPYSKKSRYGFNTFLDAIDGSYCNYSAFGITGNSPKFDPTYPDPYNKKGAYKGMLQCGKYKPAKVISVSYIFGERSHPTAYLQRQCNEFLKLGMQGVSLIWASGDRGVAEHFPGRLGSGCLGKHHRTFGANSPLDCPYITGVGSTLFKNGKEVATTLFGSGGGFSNVFPRPAYQDVAVTEYLKKHTPPYKSYNTSYNQYAKGVTGRYNRGGRGYPDIAAIGENYLGVYKGRRIKWAGTSLSAPLTAGIIARINGHRLAAGKSTLGFLNPVLYKHPEMFNDIVEGNNPGCHSKGFSCARGWNPVTGLGSPNYPKLKKILTDLP